MFKEGDKVYSILKGWGVVLETAKKKFIAVEFKDINNFSTFYYHPDGRQSKSDIIPELYTEEKSVHAAITLTPYNEPERDEKERKFAKYLDDYLSDIVEVLNNPKEHDVPGFKSLELRGSYETTLKLANKYLAIFGGFDNE